MCLAGANVATYRLPATQLSGCKTGTPSQADVDRPDPQEILVSKEACLQFYKNPLLGPERTLSYNSTNSNFLVGTKIQS